MQTRQTSENGRGQRRECTRRTCVRQPPAPVRRVSTLAMILNADAEKPLLSAPRVSVSVSPTVSTPHSVLSFHHPPFEPPTAPTAPQPLLPPSLFHSGLQSPSSPTSSRKRNRDPDENEDDTSPKKKIARDDVIVALHCTLSMPIPPSPLSSR